MSQAEGLHLLGPAASCFHSESCEVCSETCDSTSYPKWLLLFGGENSPRWLCETNDGLHFMTLFSYNLSRSFSGNNSQIAPTPLQHTCAIDISILAMRKQWKHRITEQLGAYPCSQAAGGFSKGPCI